MRSMTTKPNLVVRRFTYTQRIVESNHEGGSKKHYCSPLEKVRELNTSYSGK